MKIPDAPEGGHKLYVSRIRLDNQPQVGTRWQAQEQIIQTD